MTPVESIAVIGVGRMGAAMAGTLGRAGFRVTVWNRSPKRAREVAAATDATVSQTPAEAAAGTDLSLTSLADDAAVEAVYLGEDGIVSGIRPGGLALDTSTIDPETVQRVGAAVDAAGAGFLDAPVSGSVSTVEKGGLTIMVGGDPDLIPRVQPVLDALATRVIPIGSRGSGAAAKLAVNSLVHGLNVALSEALVLAERAGVDRTTAYEVFASGAAGAPFVQYKRAAYENPDTTPVAFSLDLVAKDLELITALGGRVGAPQAQAETGLAIVRAAVAAGMGDADLSALAVYLRQKAGSPRPAETR
ncbi:MAG TPA: NAD(P)-dependent oxidoreductase [Acidimicrobiia bacterium]|nr:NAD(P)-dependent oxidoreductase [Acidimicrobiia bacterium]